MKPARRPNRITRMASLPAEDPVQARLVAIAADHVRRFGVTRVRVVAIAQEAGMSHANVYRFFPSRERLIEAIVVAFTRATEMALADIANAPDPADDKLERFLITWARTQREACERDPAIFGLYAKLFQDHGAMIAAHRARLRTLIATILDEGQEPGPFRIRDEERAAAFVSDAMQRFVHPVLVGETRDLSRAQVEARLVIMARMVLRTLIGGAT